MGHIARSTHRRRARRSLRQPQHAARRRHALRDLRTGLRSCVELHLVRMCRFLAGIAIGGSSVLAPEYLAEIAPANRRGALVGLFQVNIVIGILLAHSSNSSHRQRDALDIQRADCRLLPRHRGAFRGRAVRFFCEHDGAAIHRGFFLDAGNARRGTGTNERCAPYDGAKSLAPQYVTPRNDEQPCLGD